MCNTISKKEVQDRSQMVYVRLSPCGTVHASHLPEEIHLPDQKVCHICQYPILEHSAKTSKFVVTGKCCSSSQTCAFQGYCGPLVHMSHLLEVIHLHVQC